MKDASGWADFWSIALHPIGYQTSEIVSNARSMQEAWARENNVAFDDAGWLFEITAAQVKKFKPDVLFVNDYTTFSADYIRNLRTSVPSIKLVIGWCGAPYTNGSVFKSYDVILSSVPELVSHFTTNGLRSYQMNHAFEPRILERIDTSTPPTVEFAFIGSIVKKDKFHHERERLLVRLIEESGLEVWTDVHRPSVKDRLGVLARRAAYDGYHLGARFLKGSRHVPILNKVAEWKQRPSLPAMVDDRISRHSKPPLFGLEMFQQLQRSRVIFNNHIDLSSSYASNLRLYEATGVGSCLLTDWKSNLAELFEADAEIVTYKNADECIEKLRFLLSHPEERSAIALAGQARTLRAHTFALRAAQLDELIRSSLIPTHSRFSVSRGF